MTIGLDVEEVRVRFGGLIALDGITLAAPLGRITGLIGPNGAGKSTLLNVCSGLVRADGRINLFGQSLDRMSPAARARRGMTRTFQRMELFNTLTVNENVEMGCEAAWVGSGVIRSLYRSATARKRVKDARDEAVALCGLEPLAGRVTGSLSTGQRRFVEFARALANPARLLLLDEPSSGLDEPATRRFGEVIQRAVDLRGLGVLLVEHDMTLIRSVCDYVYVLDFGRQICEGNTRTVLTNTKVQAAYLGSGPNGVKVTEQSLA